MIPTSLVIYSMTATLGGRLKQVRKELDLSQSEMAAKLGTYQQRYAHWETGHTRPDPDELKNIADVLNITADWLIGRDAAAKPYPTELDREIFLLREEAKQYGPDSVKRLRKMLPLIFEQKPKGKTK